jgi:hypothetical protein
MKNEARMLQDGKSRHNRNASGPTCSGQIIALTQPRATVLNLADFLKKSVAGVATLKPPKEDGDSFALSSIPVGLPWAGIAARTGPPSTCRTLSSIIIS